MPEINQLIHDVMCRRLFNVPGCAGYFYEISAQEMLRLQCAQSPEFVPLEPVEDAIPCLHLSPADFSTIGSSGVAYVRNGTVVGYSALTGD
jgi:hypothetical protein